MTHPGHGEVGHELLEGPGLLRLLLVVQRDLVAELPGGRATCARGAGHGVRSACRWKQEKTRSISHSPRRQTAASPAAAPS